LDKAESELADKKQELRALKDHIRTEAAEMVARKKRFVSLNFILVKFLSISLC
jgi:flagellar motility protein MotE (MotC chaperone)